MKNVHLLPTDKPSRLCYDKSDNLLFAPNAGFSTADGKQHIYITSNEEIKIGDKGWLFEDSYVKSVCEFDCTKGLEGIRLTDKKIILTTDQDLIKDGVQEIDDEFLEWFVKNPSCEWVEIEGFEPIYGHQNNSTDILYKIIIPQEEPKSHIEYINTDDFTSMIYNPQEEPNYMLKGGSDAAFPSSTTITFKPKQETLEEAADIDSKNHYKDQLDYWAIGFDSFKRGAKWQAKRMYSEEEAKQIWKAGQEYWKTSGNSITFEELTEQFKKK
jgi:hypothetical protein